MKIQKKLMDIFFKLAPGGIYGLIAILMNFILISLSITQFPGYDMMNQDVSVLGIGPGLSAPLFNICMGINGIIILPFLIYLGRILQQENDNKNKLKVAKKLSIISCLSLSLIGCFPVINFIMGMIHASIALIFFLSVLISLIIFSKNILNKGNFSNLHAYFGFIISGIIIFYLITRWSIIEWTVFFALGFWITDISIYTLYKRY